jgi:SAM-dependent methyltransferase
MASRCFRPATGFSGRKLIGLRKEDLIMSAEAGANRPIASDAYGATFPRDFESPTARRLRREVYGDEYPEEAWPRSFITRSELRRMARELSVGPGQTFVDLGCGWGGPGLWVAGETKATIVGIDLSPASVARARERAAELGLTDHARFEVGDLTATGLPEASVDGAISVERDMVGTKQGVRVPGVCADPEAGRTIRLQRL